ncbi:hypothetical protein D3C78_1716040 [compost metagenome]
MDVLGNFYRLLFQREMPGVDQMQFGVGQVLEVSLGTCRNERRITPAPDNQGRGLLCAKKRLPLGVGFDIAPIILKQLDLNLSVCFRL